MSYHQSGNTPVYVPNTGGFSWADETSPTADGEMMCNVYTLQSNDDDFGQPGILVREVFTDPQRFKPVEQVAGSLLDGHAFKPSEGMGEG